MIHCNGCDYLHKKRNLYLSLTTFCIPTIYLLRKTRYYPFAIIGGGACFFRAGVYYNRYRKNKKQCVFN